MYKVHFKKGEFLTDLNNPMCFAIFGGNEVKNAENDCTMYSLIAYYNPSHATQDESGKWKVGPVFTATVDDEICCYTINESDICWWRRCSQNEITKALKFLAEMHNLAWDETTQKLRKLAPGEKLCFDEPPRNASVTGGNVPMGHRSNNTRPLSAPGSQMQRRPLAVSRIAPDDDYKFSKAICGTSEERLDLIMKAVEDVNKEEEKASRVNCYSGFGFRGPNRNFGCTGMGNVHSMSEFNAGYDDSYSDFYYD